KLPLILPVPFTSRVAVGLVVPMPTFPLSVTTIFGDGAFAPAPAAPGELVSKTIEEPPVPVDVPEDRTSEPPFLSAPFRAPAPSVRLWPTAPAGACST